MNEKTVSDVLMVLSHYGELLDSEGVPFTEQKSPGEADPFVIESQLIESAGGCTDDLIAWFTWQGGVPIGSERGRATIFAGYRPLGLAESIEETQGIPWTPLGYPAPVGPTSPWVLLAVQSPGSNMLLSNAFTGDIYDVFTHGGDTTFIAHSVQEMIARWTELWRVAMRWEPGLGMNNKIPIRDIPPELLNSNGSI